MFTSIYHVMQENQALNLNLMRTGDKLIVCFQPLASNASDAAGSNLTPLVITATPGELDAGFITAISTPLEERFAMLVNLEEFKKSTQKAQPKAGAKNTVTVEGSSQTTNSAPKKSKKDEQVEEAERLVKTGNLPGGYAVYKKLYEQDKTDVKVGNRMHELWAKMSQKPLFETDSTPVVGEVSTVQAISTATIEEPKIVVPEDEEAVVDMFAQIINPGKVEDPVITVQETKPNPILPQVDPDEYQKFLAYQQFMQAQQIPQTV